ncbi:hypothetical protein Tco_1035672 [Tanacetum coccineum]
MGCYTTISEANTGSPPEHFRLNGCFKSNERGNYVDHKWAKALRFKMALEHVHMPAVLIHLWLSAPSLHDPHLAWLLNFINYLHFVLPRPWKSLLGGAICSFNRRGVAHDSTQCHLFRPLWVGFLPVKWFDARLFENEFGLVRHTQPCGFRFTEFMFGDLIKIVTGGLFTAISVTTSLVDSWVWDLTWGRCFSVSKEVFLWFGAIDPILQNRGNNLPVSQFLIFLCSALLYSAQKITRIVPSVADWLRISSGCMR